MAKSKKEIKRDRDFLKEILMRLDSPDPQQKEYARQMIVDWTEELSEARP